MAEAKGAPTEYFSVTRKRPELAGDLVGEIVRDGKIFSLHLAAPKGQRFIRHGTGEVVIPNISRGGWQEVSQILDALEPSATMNDVKRALSESPLLDPVKEKIQR